MGSQMRLALIWKQGLFLEVENLNEFFLFSFILSSNVIFCLKEINLTVVLG